MKPFFADISEEGRYSRIIIKKLSPINLDLQVSEPIFANFVTVDKYSFTLSPEDYIFILLY